MENKLTAGKVTVLIPTYKRAEKLKRAVESILNQSYQDFVIIISDNASGDETENVVNGLIDSDNRIKYFKQTVNIGMNENFNFLVSKVNTPFFCLLTDDDYYLPNFLEDSITIFNKYPQIMFAVMSAPEINEAGDLLNDQLNKWPREGYFEKANSDIMKMVIDGNHPILTACMFRSDIIKYFIFDPKIGVFSDAPLLYELLANYPFAINKIKGLYFIKHSDNLSAKNFSLLEEYNIKVKIWNKILASNRISQEIKKVFFDYKEKKLFKYYLKSIASKNKELSENIIIEITKDSNKKNNIATSIIVLFNQLGIGRSFLPILIQLYWNTHKLWKKYF
jgi:glycosyltransferase involved in cell wall biosynthesis